jgi:hypothetical protein
LIEDWEKRYARFVATEGRSEPVADAADPPDAADFLLTLTALATRRQALDTRRRSPTTTQAYGALPMSALRTDTLLSAALRSLVVAADQRCPAIIGHAHLLYHSSAIATAEAAAEMIAQMRREAEALCRAVAAAESAIADLSV